MFKQKGMVKKLSLVVMLLVATGSVASANTLRELAQRMINTSQITINVAERHFTGYPDERNAISRLYTVRDNAQLFQNDLRYFGRNSQRTYRTFRMLDNSVRVADSYFHVINGFHVNARPFERMVRLANRLSGYFLNPPVHPYPPVIVPPVHPHPPVVVPRPPRPRPRPPVVHPRPPRPRPRPPVIHPRPHHPHHPPVIDPRPRPHNPHGPRPHRPHGPRPHGHR